MSGFRHVAKEPLFTGFVVSGSRVTIEAPDGSRHEREVVHHPGAVVVVPVTMAGTVVLLVRQYRAPLDAEMLELPAGKRDVADEDPMLTAQRELAEEVGMKAGSMRRIGQFHNSPGFSDECSLLYLATDLEPCEPMAHGIEEEHMTIEPVMMSDVDGLVADGQITDAKTIIGLCLARKALGA